MERALAFVVGCMSFFVVIATLLPLIRHEAWWIRIFDFPRIQIAVLAAVLLPAVLGGGVGRWWRYALASVLALSILYHSFRIYPYTLIAGKQVLDHRETDPGGSLSLMVSNVMMENQQVGEYRAIVRDKNPDLLLIAEPNGWWQEQLRPIEADYPFTMKCPLENTYGMLLYSRLKLIDPQVSFLIADDVPSMHTFIEMPEGDLLELHFLHPKPPQPSESPDSKERDAELVVIGRKAAKSQRPVIVAGDLNDVAWSHTTRLFQRLSGLLDPRIGRGLYNTYHAKYPLFRFPIDHVFHSNHFKLIHLERGPYFGSDHFPIYIRLSYEPQFRHEQEKPTPEAGDREESEEKIEQVQ